MADNNKQTTSNNAVKRERFVRVVESRVNKILYNLDNLGKCANKRNYEYSEDEVKKIFRGIERKTREVKIQFQSSGGNKNKFKL